VPPLQVPPGAQVRTEFPLQVVAGGVLQPTP
jgi:hypothetical protein